jgi:hypothetical protein
MPSCMGKLQALRMRHQRVVGSLALRLPAHLRVLLV